MTAELKKLYLDVSSLKKQAFEKAREYRDELLGQEEQRLIPGDFYDLASAKCVILPQLLSSENLRNLANFQDILAKELKEDREEYLQLRNLLYCKQEAEAPSTLLLQLELDLEE